MELRARCKLSEQDANFEMELTKYTMKMIFQVIIGNKFINQHPLASCNTISNKGHQVAMMNPADDLNFSLKLPFPLPTSTLQALNRNLLPVRQNPFVDEPKSALSQNIGL